MCDANEAIAGDTRSDMRYGTFGEYEGGEEGEYSFTGKQRDSATGLAYFNARYYDAEVGRFITMDPIKDGINWYVYCRNNPLKFIDPTGLSTEINEETGEVMAVIDDDDLNVYGYQYDDENKCEGPGDIIGTTEEWDIYKVGDNIYDDIGLTFDGNTLSVVDNTERITFNGLSWPAVSGSAVYDSISEGTWSLNPNDTQYWKNVDAIRKWLATWDPPRGTWPGGPKSWGYIRTELQAIQVDSKKDLTGYFVHGGAYPGSAGCIDLTNTNDAFHSWFTSRGLVLTVTVKY